MMKRSKHAEIILDQYWKLALRFNNFLVNYLLIIIWFIGYFSLMWVINIFYRKQ